MMYARELVVNWGESDPFGLVYFPRMLAWFNDTEHEMFAILGYPVNKMVDEDRTAFVMGEINFRFVGPAAYGDRIRSTIQLVELGRATMRWQCRAVNIDTKAVITEGTATRIYAKIQDDGNLKSQTIPRAIREMLGDAPARAEEAKAADSPAPLKIQN
ncbi:MAG: thioesterase family protein [Pseudomonadota bacterium]